MKRLRYLKTAILIGITLLPIGQAVAQKSLPQVPITYPGDTSETISRRALWIEGAKKEGKAVWWTSYKPAEIRSLIAPFNKIYPFINIEYWSGQTGERITRLENEHSGNSITVDILDGGEPTNYVRWRKMGIPEKYTDIIPGIAKMDKRIYSKYGDWTMPEHNVVAPQYNTNLVSAAEAPHNWNDLLDPKWKGQIGMTTDEKVWYALALGEGGWGIEKMEDFLRKLKQQQLIWTAGHTAGHNLLAAGEFKIFAESYTYQIPPSKKKGAPVEWVRVNPVVVNGSWYMLLKKAPHPNSARLFLEWFLSSQGLLTIDTVTGKGSVFPGSGTQQAKYVAGLNIVYKTEEMILKAEELHLTDRISKLLGVTAQ